jgi:hypothetical protein
VSYKKNFPFDVSPSTSRLLSLRTKIVFRVSNLHCECYQPVPCLNSILHSLHISLREEFSRFTVYFQKCAECVCSPQKPHEGAATTLM